MVLSKFANGFGGLRDVRVRFAQLSLELPEKFFAFLLQDGSVRYELCRILQRLRSNFRRYGRNPLVMFARRANVHIGGIIKMALRAGQSVSRGLSGSRRSLCLGFAYDHFFRQRRMSRAAASLLGLS
jgi:hypothetical protein